MDRLALRYRVACIAVLATTASPAASHPVDEVVQSAYLAIDRSDVALELDITPGSAVAESVLGDLDRDHNRRIALAEAAAYAMLVLKRCDLSIDGHRVAWQFDQISVPPYANLEQQADTLRIFARASWHGQTGMHRIDFQNHYQPMNGPVTANIFFRPDDGHGFQLSRQARSDDGRKYAASFH